MSQETSTQSLLTYESARQSMTSNDPNPTVMAPERGPEEEPAAKLETTPRSASSGTPDGRPAPERAEAAAVEVVMSSSGGGEGEEGEEVSGRERLKRYRREMAGRVWIPEMWGQEELLKDWIDCTAFDSSLVPNGLHTARDALVAAKCHRRRLPNSSAAAAAAAAAALRSRSS